MLRIAFLGNSDKPSRTCRRARQLHQLAYRSIDWYLGDLCPSTDWRSNTAYTIAELTYRSQIPFCIPDGHGDSNSIKAVEFTCKFG